jgi:hypothetical protein
MCGTERKTEKNRKKTGLISFCAFLSSILGANCITILRAYASPTGEPSSDLQFELKVAQKNKPSKAPVMPSKSPTSADTNEKTPKEPLKDRTSRDIRGNGGFALTTGGGFVYKTLAGPHLEFAYNLSDISQVGVNIAYGVGSDEQSNGETKFNRDLTALVVHAKYRQFLFNSFNIGASLCYKSLALKADTNVTATTSSNKQQIVRLRFDGKASSACAGASLGNQWITDSGIIIGFDWYGYFFAFAPNSSASLAIDGQVEDERYWSKLDEAADSHDSALLFYIGYQF